MKKLPNLITGTRVILSIILLFLVRQPLAFVIVYFYCGISDFADGFIARRFKIETAIGAKLDSLADFIFFAVNLFILITMVRIGNLALVIATITAIATIRVVNLIVTKQKFSQWGIIHTVANKAAGGTLFISMPICVWLGSVPSWLIISVGIVATISAIEELLILITAEIYNANRKYFFIPKDHL
ncbi:MAG: CDP-alcohol phosphatidyltransferase family protein [Clostridiales bacterium]|jgi:CDP-diacylglycerol--glycerol-3-phosphate 3-phosphatidyltransferase|nr:CDP-alcohol phosphatidyltransferase family protein [Clostridiales bacterium]